MLSPGLSKLAAKQKWFEMPFSPSIATPKSVEAVLKDNVPLAMSKTILNVLGTSPCNTIIETIDNSYNVISENSHVSIFSFLFYLLSANIL